MNNNRNSFQWRAFPEAADLLASLHRQGKSFTEIAKALSAQFKTPVSRSAAIGKAQRLGLCGTKEDARQLQLKRGEARRLELGIAKRELKAPTVKKAGPNPIGANSSRTYAPLPVMTISERQVYLDAIAADPKTISDPAFGGCRWPLYRAADDGQTIMCCNARETVPYCAGHTRFAFQKHRTPDQIEADAEVWASNVVKSGARQGATRHFNLPIRSAA